MPKRLLLLFFVLGSLADASTVNKPLTHAQACEQFDSAVVGIEAYQNGTGFIVSSDGWILTAAHLIFNPETQKDADTINVYMPDGSKVSATLVLPTSETRSHDFALIKISKDHLPFLVLGDEADAAVGSSITLIGFPLSTGLVIKFCLTGNIAAKTVIGKGDSQTSIVFFQGVSIKGISGAPLISLDTGKVIGIENVRLTGITPALEKTKRDAQAQARTGGSVSIMGLNIVPTVYNIIDVLDTQLANGLGAGNGVTAARLAMDKARKERK